MTKIGELANCKKVDWMINDIAQAGRWDLELFGILRKCIKYFTIYTQVKNKNILINYDKKLFK